MYTTCPKEQGGVIASDDDLKDHHQLGSDRCSPSLCVARLSEEDSSDPAGPAAGGTVRHLQVPLPIG